MRIVGAEWAPVANLLHIACACGKEFVHQANRWTVRCPSCKRTEYLGKLRDQIKAGDIR